MKQFPAEDMLKKTKELPDKLVVRKRVIMRLLMHIIHLQDLLSKEQVKGLFYNRNKRA